MAPLVVVDVKLLVDAGDVAADGLLGDTGIAGRLLVCPAAGYDFNASSSREERAGA